MALILPRRPIFDHVPVVHLPQDERSNLINPPSLASAISHVNSIALICMAILVICRFWVRGAILRNLSWDDWTCVIAAIASIGQSGLILYDINLKLGVHMWDIAESLFMNPRTIRLLESIDLVYPIAIYFVKLSILLFYRRIFNTDRSLRLVIQITIIFLTAFYTAFSCIQIATVWQCAIWLTVNEYPICTNDYAIDVFQSGLNVLTSLFVFLLPLRNLLKLNLGKLQMIGFIVIYGFGLIDCLISVARVVLIVKLDQLDDLWNNGLISILSVIEINLGIIIACAPIIPHFFKRKQKTPSPIRVYSPTPPTPPAKEISYNLKAPPSSRIGHYPLIPLSGRALARSGAMSPDREKYTELEDHSLVLPMKMERAELSAYRTVSYYEVDTVPTKGLPTRWIRSSRRM